MKEIKEAFQKVKQDISFLTQEIEFLKVSLAELNFTMSNLREEIKRLKHPIFPFIPSQDLVKSSSIQDQAHRLQFQTHMLSPSTQNTIFTALKDRNLSISTGNEGVQTDRQTHQQTDRHIENGLINSIQQPIQLPQPSSQNHFNPQELTPNKIKEYPSKVPTSQILQQEVNPLQNAAQILDSLDALKKEIRLKFKRLTEKEILVFSALYQLEEQEGYTDYRGLSKKLSLTESSIRDYIKRLVDKGIPVEKNKINNKTIQLKISDSLKKIASLSTILQLRDI